MNDHFLKSVVRKLDTAGLEERAERREAIRKQEAQQTPQQVDVAGAIRRGMRSFLDEAHREINVKRLLNDPVTRFFVLANRNIDSA